MLDESHIGGSLEAECFLMGCRSVTSHQVVFSQCLAGKRGLMGREGRLAFGRELELRQG
jgi:hypothetical protein